MSIVIRDFEREDIPQIAEIHYKYLKLGLLSRLGESFLQRFYKSLLKNSNTFTLVAVDDSQIVGFVTGAMNLRTIPRTMIYNLWFPAAVAVAKRPAIIAKLIKTFFYPSFRENKKVGEIFSLVVIPSYRKHGIGAKLVKSCQKEFKKRGCKNYQVSVREKMVGANQFYQKLNLKKRHSTEFLGEEINFYGTNS